MTTTNSSPSFHAPDPILNKVLRLADAGDYQAALGLLRDSNRQPLLRNARGVCLLRLGRIDDAVRVFRDLVLQPGCTWMRPELPVEFKLNFATALFLSGRPSGSLEMLAEIRDEQHPTVILLRAEIRKWESTLTWWQRLNWRIGRIDPPTPPAGLSFPPGDFGVRASAILPSAPDQAVPPLGAMPA